MSGKIDDLIPSAKELRKQASIKEAEKAEEHLRWAAAADAEKRALIEKLSKPSGLSEDKKDRAGRDRHPAGSPQRTEGGSGLSLPEFLVHRPWPRHQSAGARLGEHTDGHSKGNIPALDRLPETAGLSHRLPDHRLPGRHAGRHRHHHCLGRLRLLGRIQPEATEG